MKITLPDQDPHDEYYGKYLLRMNIPTLPPEIGGIKYYNKASERDEAMRIEAAARLPKSVNDSVKVFKRASERDAANAAMRAVETANNDVKFQPPSQYGRRFRRRFHLIGTHCANAGQKHGSKSLRARIVDVDSFFAIDKAARCHFCYTQHWTKREEV